MKMVVDVTHNKYKAIKALDEGGVDISSEQKAILNGTSLKTMLEELKSELIRKTWDDYFMPVNQISSDDIDEVLNKYIEKCEDCEP